MKFLKFEIKKVLKQKKYVWALLVVFLVSSGLFWMNVHQRSRQQGNWARYQAGGIAWNYTLEWSRRESALINLRDQRGLNEMEEKQLEYSRKMALAIQRLQICYSWAMWDRVPPYKENFLNILDSYSKYGGEFSVLDGMDRDIARAKNNWLLENELAYEFERAPLSQHLFMADSSRFFFGFIGIGILIFLFGATLIEEKENNTWLTLKTQPISKVKLILSKYFTSLLMVVAFMGFVIISGLMVPMITEGWTLELSYPRILIQGDSFQIISTAEYLVRISVLFFSASAVAISLCYLISRRVSRTLILYLVMAIVIGGAMELSSIIKSPINPFYVFNTNEILSSILTRSQWVQIVFLALAWSVFFLFFAIILPDSKPLNIKFRPDKPFSKGKVNYHKNILHNLYIFEWRKILREGLLKKLAIIILVIVVGGHNYLSNLAENQINGYLDELEWRVEGGRVVIWEEALNYYREQKDNFYKELGERANDPINQPRKENLTWLVEVHEWRLAFEKELQGQARDAFFAYKNEDWQTFYEYQINVNQGELGSSNDTRRNFTEYVSIHQKEILKERNIRPILPGENISNIHQFWRTQVYLLGWLGQYLEQKEWVSQNRGIDNSGVYYLYLSFSSYAYLLILVFLLIFIGGGMAREKGKKKTFNLLVTQPISQGKIFIGKIINTSVIWFISTLAVSVILVLVGTILSRFGDWNYPILFYRAYRETLSPDYVGFTAAGQGYDFMTLGRYLIHCMILLGLISLLINLASNFLSIFVKRTMGVWAATIVIFTSFYWLTWRKPLNVSPFSPLTYFNIPIIANGEMAARLNDPRFNVLTGVLVLLGLKLILLAAVYVAINKKMLYDLISVKVRELGTKGIAKRGDI